MMKKLLLLLTVAIAMLALPLAAHADKTKWTNPNYDFNKLHRINLVSISVVDPVGSNFTVDDMATEKIISALQKALTKKDYVFDTSIESNLSITKEDASQLTKDALSGTYTDISTKIAPAPTADLKIIAHKFGYNRRVIPAHEEPRTRYYKEKVKDNKGNWIERDAERTVYEYVPASTVYDGYVDVAFHLFDPATGKIIFSLRDTRSRTADSDTTNMWQRMANAFVQDLEEPDITRSAHVSTATQLDRGAEAHHTHPVAVFLAEEHHRPGRCSLFLGGIAFLLEGIVRANGTID